MTTYFLINFGIGAVAGLAFLIIKIATKPKMCDSCKRLIRKGGGSLGRYECKYNYSETFDFTNKFDRCPKYCRYYDPKEF